MSKTDKGDNRIGLIRTATTRRPMEITVFRAKIIGDTFNKETR